MIADSRKINRKNRLLPPYWFFDQSKFAEDCRDIIQLVSGWVQPDEWCVMSNPATFIRPAKLPFFKTFEFQEILEQAEKRRPAANQLAVRENSCDELSAWEIRLRECREQSREQAQARERKLDASQCYRFEGGIYDGKIISLENWTDVVWIGCGEAKDKYESASSDHDYVFVGTFPK